MKTQIRRIVRSVWFRGLVTAGLLTLVASQIDWQLMRASLENGDPAWLLVAVGLVILALVTGAFRWWLLLRASKVMLEPHQVGRVYAMSTFASTFLPTSMGGDVARALLVARRGRVLVRTSLSIVLDRIAGLIGLLVVASVSWAFDPSAVSDSEQRPLVLLSVFFVAAGVIALVVVARSPQILVRRVPERMHDALRDIRTITLRCVRDPLIGVPVILASVVFQTLVVLQICALARSISVDLPFAAAAITVTLVTLATLIPLSIAGFGVREGGYVLLLGTIGISATDATIISLESVAVLFIASLPGAFLLMRHGAEPVLDGTPS